ncbi:hypothetical protein HZH66_004076 [Vespula vulgaris]|uniref:Uncharacterized protein n=1 Tax=Vespula vulgaris TaxID=7454 RepID=A0A834NDP3_VESVU|nr:hypothetical protein HZH66_004076 [Vespula vulgaris]
MQPQSVMTVNVASAITTYEFVKAFILINENRPIFCRTASDNWEQMLKKRRCVSAGYSRRYWTWKAGPGNKGLRPSSSSPSLSPSPSPTPSPTPTPTPPPRPPWCRYCCCCRCCCRRGRRSHQV